MSTICCVILHKSEKIVNNSADIGEFHNEMMTKSFFAFLATCPEYQKNKKIKIFSAAVRKKKAKKLRRIFAVGFSAANNLRQNKLHSLRLFCFAKNQSTVPLFFLSAKSHARLSCSLINALTQLRCRYQLFAVFLVLILNVC